MKISTLILLFISVNCFSQIENNNIDIDTVIINTKLSDTTIYNLGSVDYSKSVSAWFSFVNDSGKQLLINNISTGDGGTYVLYNGKQFNGKVLKPNEKLIFCVFFEANHNKISQNRGISINGLDPKDQTFKSLVRFKILSVRKI